MYNFPHWSSDEKAKLRVHDVKPFLKILDTVEAAISNLFARSWQVLVVQVSEKLIFNGECCRLCCWCKWYKEYYNMQEHTPCWQACILVCKRIITSDYGSMTNG